MAENFLKSGEFAAQRDVSGVTVKEFFQCGVVSLPCA